MSCRSSRSRSRTGSTTSPSSTCRTRRASAAGSCLPTRFRKPRGSGRSPRRGQARLQPRHGRPARRRPRASAAAPPEAARARPRLRDGDELPPLTEPTALGRHGVPDPALRPDRGGEPGRPARHRGRAHQPARTHERHRLPRRLPARPVDRVRGRAPDRLGRDDEPGRERGAGGCPGARVRRRPARHRVAAAARERRPECGGAEAGEGHARPAARASPEHRVRGGPAARRRRREAAHHHGRRGRDRRHRRPGCRSRRHSSASFYVLVAGVLVWVPVAVYLVAGDHADRWLEAAQSWLTANERRITFVSTLLFGFLLTSDALVRLV